MRTQARDDLIGDSPGPPGDIFSRDAFILILAYKRDRIARLGFGISEVHSDIIHRNLACEEIAFSSEKYGSIFPRGIRITVAVPERYHRDRGILLGDKFPAISDRFAGPDFLDKDDAAFE